MSISPRAFGPRRRPAGPRRGPQRPSARRSPARGRAIKTLENPSSRRDHDLDGPASDSSPGLPAEGAGATRLDRGRRRVARTRLSSQQRLPRTARYEAETSVLRAVLTSKATPSTESTLTPPPSCILAKPLGKPTFFPALIARQHGTGSLSTLTDSDTRCNVTNGASIPAGRRTYPGRTGIA